MIQNSSTIFLVIILTLSLAVPALATPLSSETSVAGEMSLKRGTRTVRPTWSKGISLFQLVRH